MILGRLLRARSRASIKRRLATNLSIAFLLTLLSVPLNAPEAEAATVGSGNCVQDVGTSTGVTVTSVGSDCIVSFTATGSNTWTVPNGVTSVRALVVGGGGGGGAWVGGGGGGGGFRDVSAVSVTPGASISLAVGAGGNPASVVSTSYSSFGTNGADSSFGSITSTGGGRGASHSPTGAAEALANSGGSGGGATGSNTNDTTAWRSLRTGANGNTPATSPAQGFKGGNGFFGSVWVAGGGGGAGGAGADGTSTAGGAGGIGASSNITGTSLFYAGGGGGIVYNSTTGAGSGGSGGGGAGTANGTGVSGTANTGGGGGGGGSNTSQTSTGGSGGSGVVIIRYTTATQSAGTGNCSQTYTSTGLGSVSVTEANGFCYIAFRNTGSVNSQTTFGLTKPANVNTIDYLVVAGGGGGAVRHGGGGGAGGLLKGTLSVSSLTAISAVVGAGGAGGVPPSGLNYGPGTSGQDSSLQSVIAKGGGAGNTGGAEAAFSGGSGGGALATNGGALGTVGQGNSGAGGIGGVSPYSAGGGGGAGGAGTAGSGSNGGAGGAGAIWDSSFTTTIAQSLGWASSSPQFSGNQVFFAGGGGGGVAGGTGGLGSAGGGAGSGNANGTSATAASGSGGGGSGCCFSNPAGGNGGSGVVIIRYAIPPVITFNANDGSGSPTTGTQAVASGVSTVLNSNTFTRSGFLFSGWTANADGTGTTYADGASISINSATTLYAKWIPVQNVDSSLVLSGTAGQYGQVSGGQIIPATGAFTVQAWFQADSNVTNNSNAVLISQGTGSNRFYIKRNTAGSVIFYRDGGSTETACGIASANTWHHVAISYNGSGTSTCYLNGALRATLSASTSISTGFAVGDYSVQLNQRVNTWKGAIDEVRVYNSARTASEILTDLSTYGPTNTSSLVVYYDFNEGSSTTIFNKKDAANSTTNLTLSGSPSFSDIAITSSNGNSTVVTFQRSYLNNSGGWATPANVTSAQVLVVGGGGGGGDSNSVGEVTGGGGGAGGYFSNSAVPLSGIIPIGVGVAGTGALTTNSRATNGGDSWLGTLKVGGGGGGNSYNYTIASAASAGNGGTDYVVGGNGGGGRSRQNTSNASINGGAAGAYSLSGISFGGTTFTGSASGAGGSGGGDFGSGGLGGSIDAANRTSSISGSSIVYAKRSDYRPWGHAGNTQGSKTYGSGGSTNYMYGSTESSPDIFGGDGAQGVVIVSYVSSYTITLNKGSSGSGADQTLTKTLGSNLTLPNSATANSFFTRTGYTVSGWATSDGGTQAYALGGTYSTESAITLYPVWTANTYTITLNKGSNGTGSNQTLTKTHDVNLTLPNSATANSYFTRTGYTVTGWATSDGGTQAYALGGTYSTESATTLYPVWGANSYTVTYNSNGGSSVSAGSFITGGSISAAPTAPTRTGFTFAGWSATDGGSAITFPYSPGVTSNITLYAKWTFSAIPVFSYNASDINSYESTSTTITDLSGNSIDAVGYRSLAFDASTYSWTFAGGGISNTTGAYVDIEDISSTQFVNASGLTIDIEADFGSSADNYERIFDLGVGGPNYGNVALGRSATSSDLELRLYQNQSTASLRYYCKSTSAITPGMHRWTVTIDGSSCRMFRNGTSLTTSVTTNVGSLPASGMTWNVNWLGRSYFGGDDAFEGKIRSARLYAGSFTPTDIQAFSYKTITYDANGGSTTPNSATTSGALRLPAAPTRTGYTFQGWYDGANYLTANKLGNASSSYSPSSSATIFAGWATGTYTITYAYNSATGGNSTTTSSFTTGGTAITLPTPTRTGYTFAGWFEDSGFAGSALGSTYSPTQSRTIYAKWNADTYTVTYAYNSATGGNSTATSSFTSGGTAITLPTPTRTGYTFAGWFEDSGFGGSALGSTYSPTQSRTIYAKWTEVNYTITYNVNGASGTPEKSTEVYGISTGALTLPSAGSMTYAGYRFDGWAESVGGTKLTSPYTPTSTRTLYARWIAASYAITYFDTSKTSGSAPSATSFTTGGSAVIVAGAGTLARSGYTFAGWNTQIDGTGTNYAQNDSLTTSAPVNLYPRWTAVNYTVTYSTNNSTSGSAPTDALTYIIGDAITVKGNSGTLARTGYSFAGWTDNSSGTGTVYQSGETYTVSTSNVTFYPKWTANTYNITYNTNGATGTPARTSDTYTTGDPAVTLPGRGTMAKTGYTFTGWSTSPTGIGQTSATTTSDVTLYAIWDLNRYSISFNRGRLEAIDLSGSQVATFPANTQADFRSSITLGSAPTNVSSNVTVNSRLYQFFGWSDGNTIYNPGQTYQVGDSAPTFTAQWIRLYEVRYALNGGTGIVDIDSECTQSGNTCLANQSITLSQAPTREGHTFTGWKDQSNATFSAGESTAVTDSSFVYYAQWSPIPYSISFNSVGGSQNPVAQTKTIGQTVTLPDPGTRSGYDFSGWTVGGVTYGVGTNYTVGASNAVFTALWTAKRYNVSYDWNGGVGTPTSSTVFTHGNAAITLPTGSAHTKDGYVFDGWAVRVNGTLENNGAAVGLTHTPTSDVQYVARWIDGAYTITYDARGGSGIAASASVNRTTSTTLPTPTRANYSFEGWYEDSATTVLYGAAGASKTPIESKTIYAKWVQDSLYGINSAHLNSLTSITVTGSHTWSGTHPASGTGASLSIPAGALPNNTVVQVSFVEDLTRPKDLINQNYAYYTSVVLHWQLGSGSSATVPVAASGKPLELTLTNPDIRAGAKIYKIIKGTATHVATATQDGQITIEVSEDPEIVVAAAAPTAPRAVTALGNQNAQSTVSWTAPLSSGGAAVTSYTVTSSPGNKTCTATGTTSCTVTGLTNDTSYTFTVVANNAVGSSSSSAASSAIIPRLRPTYTATFDSKGGSSVSGTLFNNTDGISAPTTPTRSGFNFGGWLTTDGDSSTIVTFPYSPGVNSDVTLFAYWISTSQNSSGGSSSSSASSNLPSISSPSTQSGSTSAQSNSAGTRPNSNLPQGPIEYIAPQSSFPELKDAPYPTNGFNVPAVGQFIGLIEGKPIEVVVKPQETQTVIEFGSDVAITLISQGTTGDPIEVGPNGSLTVIQGAFIQAQGNGFKSNSPVEAWLHSEPIRLGSGFANAAGEFENKFTISTEIPLGEHTLVLNGLTGEGEIVTLALGIEVKPISNVEQLPQDPSDNPGLLESLPAFLWLMLLAFLAGIGYLAYRRRHA